ncbi:MAG: hypothetical protein U5R31_05270 [Acidimicrobiia bacterium]|nr:hypothetical protein [Acidimicrobiia bacterium]
MISQFPLTEGDEVVTRTTFLVPFAELRGELRGEMADLRGQKLRWRWPICATSCAGRWAISARRCTPASAVRPSGWPGSW